MIPAATGEDVAGDKPLERFHCLRPSERKLTVERAPGLLSPARRGKGEVSAFFGRLRLLNSPRRAEHLEAGVILRTDLHSGTRPGSSVALPRKSWDHRVGPPRSSTEHPTVPTGLGLPGKRGAPTGLSASNLSSCRGGRNLTRRSQGVPGNLAGIRGTCTLLKSRIRCRRTPAFPSRRPPGDRTRRRVESAAARRAHGRASSATLGKTWERFPACPSSGPPSCLRIAEVRGPRKGWRGTSLGRSGRPPQSGAPVGAWRPSREASGRSRR